MLLPVPVHEGERRVGKRHRADTRGHLSERARALRQRCGAGLSELGLSQACLEIAHLVRAKGWGKELGLGLGLGLALGLGLGLGLG